ncbi:hypothetical protein GCM10020254_68350 [Streptomyces goshikiensis]
MVATCRHLGCEPAALEADFDRVGDTLVSLEEHIREDLMPGPDLLEIADPLTHLVGSWSLERARAGAWAAARLLWALRRSPELTAEFTQSLDAGVGLVGRCLLTPGADRAPPGRSGSAVRARPRGVGRCGSAGAEALKTGRRRDVCAGGRPVVTGPEGPVRCLRRWWLGEVSPPGARPGRSRRTRRPGPGWWSRWNRRGGA